MDKAFAANVSTTAPTQGTAIGFPQDGDIPNGKAATVPGAGWFWAVTAELLGLITAGGLTPSAGALNQVVTAVTNMINTIVTAAVSAAVASLTAAINSDFTSNLSTAVNGHRALPGGLVEQWCELHVASAGSTEQVITYPTPFLHTAHTPRVSATNPGATNPGTNSFVGVTVVSSSLSGCIVYVGAVPAGDGSTTICVDVKGT